MNKRLHIPYTIAIAGAHYNNWNYTDVAADLRTVDSLDDQYSIALGYNTGHQGIAAIKAGVTQALAEQIAILYGEGY